MLYAVERVDFSELARRALDNHNMYSAPLTTAVYRAKAHIRIDIFGMIIFSTAMRRRIYIGCVSERRALQRI